MFLIQWFANSGISNPNPPPHPGIRIWIRIQPIWIRIRLRIQSSLNKIIHIMYPEVRIRTRIYHFFSRIKIRIHVFQIWIRTSVVSIIYALLITYNRISYIPSCNFLNSSSSSNGTPRNCALRSNCSTLILVVESIRDNPGYFLFPSSRDFCGEWNRMSHAMQKKKNRS